MGAPVLTSSAGWSGTREDRHARVCAMWTALDLAHVGWPAAADRLRASRATVSAGAAEQLLLADSTSQSGGYMPQVTVPVDVLHWVLAVLPIVVLLVFLVPLRWRAPEAAPVAMFTVAIVALIAFKT